MTGKSIGRERKPQLTFRKLWIKWVLNAFCVGQEEDPPERVLLHTSYASSLGQRDPEPVEGGGLQGAHAEPAGGLGELAGDDGSEQRRGSGC